MPSRKKAKFKSKRKGKGSRASRGSGGARGTRRPERGASPGSPPPLEPVSPELPGDFTPGSLLTVPSTGDWETTYKMEGGVQQDQIWDSMRQIREESDRKLTISGIPALHRLWKHREHIGAELPDLPFDSNGEEIDPIPATEWHIIMCADDGFGDAAGSKYFPLLKKAKKILGEAATTSVVHVNYVDGAPVTSPMNIVSTLHRAIVDVRRRRHTEGFLRSVCLIGVGSGAFWASVMSNYPGVEGALLFSPIIDVLELYDSPKCPFSTSRMMALFKSREEVESWTGIAKTALRSATDSNRLALTVFTTVDDEVWMPVEAYAWVSTLNTCVLVDFPGRHKKIFTDISRPVAGAMSDALQMDVFLDKATPHPYYSMDGWDPDSTEGLFGSIPTGFPGSMAEELREKAEATSQTDTGRAVSAILDRLAELTEPGAPGAAVFAFSKGTGELVNVTNKFK